MQEIVGFKLNLSPIDFPAINGLGIHSQYNTYRNSDNC